MEGNDYIVPIFHTAFGKILGVFRAEGVYGTIVCLEGDGVGGTADYGSGYSERNMLSMVSGSSPVTAIMRTDSRGSVCKSPMYVTFT